MKEKRKLALMNRTAGSETKVKKRSKAELCRAASKIVERDCVEFVEALSRSSQDGHAESTRFLYELAGLSDELGASEGAHQFRTLAMRLTEQSPWSRKPEAVATTTIESRTTSH